jgi:hypothetical protein
VYFVLVVCTVRSTSYEVQRMTKSWLLCTSNTYANTGTSRYHTHTNPTTEYHDYGGKSVKRNSEVIIRQREIKPLVFGKKEEFNLS